MPNKQQPIVKPLNNYWVVVGKGGMSYPMTIGWSKSNSTNLATDYGKTCSWKEMVNKGYRCIKVNIEFKPTK